MAHGKIDITFGDLGRGFQIGINSGPIQLPPERPETPPSPSSTVPFLRDPDYVDRQALLEQVHAKCSIPASRTALVGLGGVGKSQLAIEYSYRISERSPEIWVFWLHGNKKARLEQGYREITERAKIMGRKDPQANVFKLVHDWLCDKRNGKWLLILDNIDDARFLNEPPAISYDRLGGDWISEQPLLAYLPQSQNGSILITTRSKEAALRLVEGSNIIPIEPMDVAHASELLEKKLGKSDSLDIAELASALEFMPLAIVQAAAYISQRAPRSSVQHYLKEFYKSDHKSIRLLSHEAGQLRRDWGAKNSIIMTWQISFDHICRIRPSAADLLSLMCFFDWQGIPEFVLRSQSDSIDSGQDHGKTNHSNFDENSDKDDMPKPSSISDGFEDDVSTLRDYSFISINVDNTAFKMHRLVQLATRNWLQEQGKQEKFKQHFIKNLNTEFPTGKYENWEKCRLLLPHAQLAATQQPKEREPLRIWASILYRTAWYALELGDWVQAERLSIQAMEVQESILGREHNDTLNSIATLAATYRNQGQWDEAEKLEVEVMETRKTKLSTDHLDTLTGMANLAATYRYQGRWDEAEKLEVEVMETRKTKRGVDHHDTLRSMANLASTYWNQGRWDEAEKLQVEVMETSKRKLGADHPDTLNSMANLAATYWNQGRWDEAEKLQVEVMETRKTKLGVDHHDTLRSMANLASTYWNQGRWDEAEKLQVEVVETSKRKLGVDHPDTLTSMNNLAFTWKARGQDHKALELMEDCVQLQTRVLGINHLNTNSSSATLGKWKSSRTSRRLK